MKNWTAQILEVTINLKETQQKEKTQIRSFSNFIKIYLKSPRKIVQKIHEN